MRHQCASKQVLLVGAVLFAIGLYMALSKRNAVGVLMGIELMLNAVNVTLLAFSRFIDHGRGDPIDGQVFATFVITVAAAEAAVALALAVAVYQHRETVNIDEIDLLRW